MFKRKNYQSLLKGKQQDSAIGNCDPASVIPLGRGLAPALFTEELFEDLQVVSLNTCQPWLAVLLLTSEKRQTLVILLSWLYNECTGLPIHVTISITAFALFLLLAIYAT